jgi:PAS domain S-box-containing protein
MSMTPETAASPVAQTTTAPGAFAAPLAKILVVDDDERTALAVSTVLEELNQTLVVASSGEEALRHLLQDDFAVILLDLHMPGMDGYETAEMIRARKKTRSIPIIFLTAVFRDDSHLLQAYSAGAVDLVFKPVDPFILKSKVSVFVDLYLKQAEIKREAELRHRLQEENFRVISEKHSTEATLNRVRERQAAILETLPLCFHSRSIEPPFAAQFVSGNVEKITGFSAQRFLDDPGFGISLVHPEDVGRVQAVLERASATGSYSCEFRCKCADDSYRVLLDQGVLAPAEDGRGRELFGTMLDITERRQLEEQLAQAQKMETVGQLTGGIAHDFNNLLTIIFGNLEFLRRDVKANTRTERQLSAMHYAAERGRTLTSQLLAFSRRQLLVPKTLDINVLIESFLPLVRRAVGESIVVNAVLAPEPAVCDVDSAQLESALLNLAINARDACAEGGTLTIAVSRIQHAVALQERQSDARPGPWILITVRDSGEGIPSDILSRVFEPFFTTKQPGQGSGLGLSQVYGFVRQSDGFITIDSELHQGTEFAIYLPASEKNLSHVQSNGLQPQQPTPSTAAKRILLVEDDSALQALSTEILLDLGYSVVTASDANGALEILKRDPAIDLVFSDVIMPGGKSGVTLAADAVELRPELKVLLTSGYAGENLDKHKISEASVPFIAKPFTQAELARQLQKIFS